MKNTQKSFIVPLILVIVAIFVVGRGIYVYQKNKQQTIPDSVSMQDNSSTTTTSSNWKTYSSSQYNFQFNYPSSLNLTSSGATDASQSGTVQPTLNTLSFKDTTGSEYFNVIVFPERSVQSSIAVNDYNNGYLSLGSACDTRWLDSKPSLVQTQMQNGISVVEVQVKAGGENCYYLKNPAGNIIVFNFTGQVDNEERTSILSSLTLSK